MARHGSPGRVGSTIQNALEVARLGGLETGEEPSPYAVVAEKRVFRLRRYFPDAPGTTGRPLILVPPLMLTADVYDVSPRASAVQALHEQDVDVWVVDFGSPEHEPGGLERTLTDHVLAVDEAIDIVRETTGTDVHLGGYSQGGMFCYQTAAYRRSSGLASIVTFGSPVDLRGAIPLGIPEGVAVKGVGLLADTVIKRTFIPSWATRLGFRMMDPVKSLQQRLDFIMALHDREALLPREGQRRYLMSDGWTAWPGPALADFLQQFLVHNRMLIGGFTIGDRTVTLADINSPILTFVGEVDDIAPPAAVRPIRQAAPRPDIYEVPLPAGHFGLVVGRTAMNKTWPVVADWLRWKDGASVQPDSIRLAGDESGGAGTDAGEQLDLVVSAGSSAIRGIAGSAVQSLRRIGQFASIARSQGATLRRIASIDATTRTSLGLLMDEQAEHHPDNPCFLFEDRVYSFADVKRSVDEAVTVLLGWKIRSGDHVGVLMYTRPTALAAIIALNRIGAVAVVLRPGGDLNGALRAASVTQIVADPEHADTDAGGRPVHTLLLQRPWQSDDPDAGFIEKGTGVDRMPDWYVPNPGRGGDLAFVLLSGDYSNPRKTEITNARFALSAFGTAMSARLTSDDTVYSINPLYHPSGLLTSIGGAVAGGARMAMASTTDEDHARGLGLSPDTFWEEVRRYGVTVVSYTWAQLRDLVNAPEHPNEHAHPIRLFVGSGIPRSLRRRVIERFAPASVLDFWATSEGEAILANIDSTKPGSLGRPLPGTAEVRVVRYEPAPGGGSIVYGEDGYAIETDDNEVGLLIARVNPMTSITAPELRDLFERDDRWFSSDSLVRRDEDGDMWLIDLVRTVIHTADGPVFSLPITAAIGKLPNVDLALTYGATSGDAGEVAAVAIVPIAGETVSAADLDDALGSLPPESRPAFAGVVQDLPMTEWQRPVADSLRNTPIPTSTAKLPVFYRDEDGHYAKYTKTARKDLTDQ